MPNYGLCVPSYVCIHVILCSLNSVTKLSPNVMVRTLFTNFCVACLIYHPLLPISLGLIKEKCVTATWNLEGRSGWMVAPEQMAMSWWTYLEKDLSPDILEAELFRFYSVFLYILSLKYFAELKKSACIKSCIKLVPIVGRGGRGKFTGLRIWTRV